MNLRTIPLFSLFLLLTFTTAPLILCLSQDAKNIVIDPAGHAKDVGRTLFKGYERTETYACALALKSALEQRSSRVTVNLTRAPGEEVVPLQNASYANRTHATLFIRLQMVTSTVGAPFVDVYTLTFDPVLDNTPYQPAAGGFIPLDHAHRIHGDKTKLLAATCRNQLKQSLPAPWRVSNQIIGLPLMPLRGIIAPAFAIEIGLANSNEEWKELLPALVDSLLHVINLG